MGYYGYEYVLYIPQVDRDAPSSSESRDFLAHETPRFEFSRTLPMVLLHAGDNFEDSSDGTRVFDLVQFLVQKIQKVQVHYLHRFNVVELIPTPLNATQGPGASNFTPLGDNDVDLTSKCERLQADLDHMMNVRVCLSIVLSVKEAVFMTNLGFLQQSLVSQVNISRQENASLQSRISVIEDNFSSSSAAWARERDLLQKQIAGLKQRDIQYQHDIRRLEREAEQLRTKLRQMLTTKDKIAKVSIPVAPVDDNSPSTSFGLIETYKSMIGRYDDQQRSLLRENEQVRLFLAPFAFLLLCSHTIYSVLSFDKCWLLLLRN